MGEVENGAGAKRRRSGLRRAILQSAALAGLITFAIAAPNALSSLPKPLREKLFSHSRSSRDTAISKLIASGYLKRDLHRGMRVLRITDKGRRHLLERQEAASIAKPRRWDGRWRIVIFDIQEPHRSTRDSIRRGLQAAGFEKLQDSVWIHPYPCEDFVALLKADMRAGKDVLYIVAEEVENETSLRRTFGLPAR